MVQKYLGFTPNQSFVDTRLYAVALTLSVKQKKPEQKADRTLAHCKQSTCTLFVANRYQLL